VVSNDPAFAAAVFTACQALIEAPNWAHVANFRRATRDLLGADTRGWIQPVNPPVLPLGAAPANALPAETPHPATV